MPIIGVIASSYRSASGTSFESIATATGSGSSNTVTFSNIPQTFKHLQIRMIGRSTGSNTGYGFFLRANGDSGSNYLRYWAVGRDNAASIVGSSAFEGQMSIGGITGANSGANMMMGCVLDVLEYTSTAKKKSFKWMAGCDQNQVFGDTYVRAGGGMWQSTSAITSISIVIDDGSSWTTASKFYLYGIKG